MKKWVALLMAMIITWSGSFGFVASAAKEVMSEPECITIDSFTGDRISNAGDLHLSQDMVSFEYENRRFRFSLSKLAGGRQKSRDIEQYYGESGDLTCCIAEYQGAYCIKVSNKAESAYNRKLDQRTNFTIFYGPDAENYIEEVRDFIRGQNMPAEKDSKAAGYSLHVLASVTTVPFAYSAGSSEGWCTSTDLGYDNYKVTSMAYSVSYNWPSDGITLWSDVANNVSAYSSPAWASAGYTTVSGLWVINYNTGAFEAETTVTAVLHVLPVLWTITDIVNMRGV